MIYLLIILIFYFLHLDFFVRYYFFGQTEHEFLVGTQVYNYDETIAGKACAFVCLCFVLLVAGLFTRHNRVRVWEEVDEAMLRRIFRWSLVACIGITFMFVVQAHILGYDEFTEAVAENSFWWQLKAIPLVACCIMFGNQVTFSTFEKSLLASFLLLSLLTLTRSTFLEVIAIVGIYRISRNNNRIRKWYLGAIILLLATVNTVATFRETRDLSASVLGEEGRKIMLKNEYLIFLDALLSETMSQFESNYLCGETFLDIFKLLVPSIIRRWIGISDDCHPIYGQIGWATFPDYGGGFSFVAECYVNFGWLGAGCMFVFGVLVKRFYTLMDFTRRKGLFSMYSVCPLVLLNLHLMYRNGAAGNIKYVIQVCVLAVVIMFICSKKTTVVSLNPDEPGN
jgi:hypothetical protein